MQALGSLWATGELQMHIGVSAREFAIGFGIAVLIGIPIGLVLGTSEAIKQYVDPLMNGLFATPLIALAPLFILWFGIGETKTIVLVFILCILPVIINTDTGVRSTDGQLLEAARSFGANRIQRFAYVQIPWALSFILTGIRLGIGRGLIGVVAGELFGSRAGMGYLILTSSQLFNTAIVLGGVLVFAVTGVVLIYVTEVIGRRIAPWRYRSARL
jgi:NitT/TauT family transport system permease protein